MLWKKTTSVFVAATVFAALTWMGGPAAGLQKRTMSAELASQLKMGPKKVPAFRAGLNAEQKKAALQRFNAAIEKGRVPNNLRDSVRHWQSLTEQQQTQMLSGGTVQGLGLGGAAAVAFVAFAVGFALSVAVNSSGDKDFQTRSISTRELDALDEFSGNVPRGYGGSVDAPRGVAQTELDWVAALI